MGSLPLPPPNNAPSSPQSPSFYAIRRQQQPRRLPSPTTIQVLPNGQPVHRPATALAGSSPIAADPDSHVGFLPSAIRSDRTLATPTMTSYNPQEWGRAGAVGGSYVPHSARARARGTTDMTGMEASMPEPPPPYTESPSASQPPSGSAHVSPQGISFAQAQSSPVNGPQHVHTPTPVVVSNRIPPYPQQQQSPPTAFPPPPGAAQRDRSESRTRGVFNSLAALANRQRMENGSPANTPAGYQRLRSDSSNVGVNDNMARSTVEQPPLPPNGRRSVSVGVGYPSNPGSRDPSRSRAASNWQPGMPLPPPPPGVPSTSRSQSVDRTGDRENQVIKSRFAALPHYTFGSTPLSPMPPTPADWKDHGPAASSQASQAKNPSTPAPPLRVETKNAPSQKGPSGSDFSIMSALEPNTGNSSSDIRNGFGRMGAVRDPSAKGIRDRRLESRARSKEPQTAIEPRSNQHWEQEEVKPLVLAETSSGTIGRRRHVAKAAASPRSGANPLTPQSPRNAPDSAKSSTSDQGGRSAPLKTVSHVVGAEPTPPFSPDVAKQYASPQPPASASFSPRPPSSASIALPSARSTNSDRRFYTPTEGPSPADAYPSSGLPRSRRKPSEDFAAGLNDFSRASLARYRDFLARETGASDDTERLELFADFIVAESRVRRDQYAQAFEGMSGGDVLDMTRDMWRSSSGGSKRGKAPITKIDTKVSFPPITQVAMSSSSSPGDVAFTPSTQADDSPNSFCDREPRQNFQRPGGFQPQLSPIMSMAQSTLNDGDESRGRAPSRWWEKSDDGGSLANGGRKVELSKRESKYMGVRNLNDMQWEDDEAPSYVGDGSSSYHQLGLNEYPLEKVGWHQQSTPDVQSRFPRTPRTPQIYGLDVSRLVTLPPPYPRHYPAVSNKHPELTVIRATLRHVQETPESSEFRSRYDVERVNAEVDPKIISRRRRDNRRNIQNRISEGTITFSAAAQAETSFEDSETSHYKGLAKGNFNSFQKTLMTPLIAVMNEKIASATSSIENLRLSLKESYDPNATQESGDELPELVEKITLMKWLFEAREQLHKELFELQCESDALYKHVIIAPYLVTSNAAKTAEVDNFFDTDGRDRRLAFATEAKARFDTFQSVIDQSVTRGVEAQLNAFWDIAPPLLELVEQVPQDTSKLANFQIHIAPSEIQENPMYSDWPMQYLYTLLSHAEKSAYQFIESQVNLCCLLHEVKLGVMRSQMKVDQEEREKQAIGRGEDIRGIEDFTQAQGREEDAKLTKELKERVQVVEDQWRVALGSALEDARRRVGEWLVEVGGWDDSLDE